MNFRPFKYNRCLKNDHIVITIYKEKTNRLISPLFPYRITREVQYYWEELQTLIFTLANFMDSIGFCYKCQLAPFFP